MKNRFIRRFGEGSQGIWGWGVVRDDILSRKVLWAPIPLHWLIRYGERAYWWVGFRAGLKNRVDCPACGQRFDRFRWTDELDYIRKLKELEALVSLNRRTIRQLRKERAGRPDPPKIPTPLREQRIGMTLAAMARMLRLDAEGLDELATQLDLTQELDGGGDNQFPLLAGRLRIAADLLELRLKGAPK